MIVLPQMHYSVSLIFHVGDCHLDISIKSDSLLILSTNGKIVGFGVGGLGF